MWPGNVAELVGSCVPIHVYQCLFDPMCLFYASDKRGTLDQEDTDNFYAWDMQGIWPVDMLYFTRRPHVTNFHKIWFNSMCLGCNHIFYISWLTAFASVRVTFHSFSKRSEVVKTMLHYGTYSDVTVFLLLSLLDCTTKNCVDIQMCDCRLLTVCSTRSGKEMVSYF